MGASLGEDAYSIPILAWIYHKYVPHVNITLHRVNSSFNPTSPVYLESLGILGSVPAAWLILTLLVLLIYLLTRCCDRKPRPSRSISALKVTLAIVSVLCCAAVGLGLYGNDDLHNGVSQLLQEGRQIDVQVQKIRNQTENIERQLRQQATQQLTHLRDIFDEPVANTTAFKICMHLLEYATDNNTAAASAAADIRNPLNGIYLAPTINAAERIEQIRWPATMAILSVLLVLCVVLLVGVARHNRCALIAFSVCGLLAVIASYVMASVYIASTVALGDLCAAPDKFVEDQASNELTKEILRYYTTCERARANPFTQRLREAKGAIENMRASLNSLKKPANEIFPRKGLDPKFSSLLNQVNEGDLLITALTSSVDCRTLHTHYLRGARALCNVGLLGLTLMLLSSVLAGFLLTILVWVDSHTWIYIRKKKDYHQVNDNDPYLPPPAASQAIAARTLQRSQGSSYPPDTPPPSYTSVMMHNCASSNSMHEAQSLIDGCDMRPPDHHRGAAAAAHMSHLRGHTLGRLPSHHHEPLSGPNNGPSFGMNGPLGTPLKSCCRNGALLNPGQVPTVLMRKDGLGLSGCGYPDSLHQTDVFHRAACKDFPNFKGFKFDQQQQQQQHHQQQQQHQQQQKGGGKEGGQQRTANINKFSSLGRRPLPQLPDEKERKQPQMPKVPATISQHVESPLNPANFRSLQRGVAWQDMHATNTSTFQPPTAGMQFRSLQRGASTLPQAHPQFRSVKIQDQTHEGMYANNESERQLYAVTEL